MSHLLIKTKGHVWWPAVYPGCVLLDGVIHAWEHHPSPGKAVCGAGEGTPVAQEFANGHVVSAWPPYQKSEIGTRCRDCWEATGKPRPSYSWRSA